MEVCFTNSVGLVDVHALRGLWGRLRVLPEPDEDAMCHGDLTPQNVLVDRGHLVGVLNTGGFGPADPALDLVSVRHLLDAQRGELVRRELRCCDVEWERGMAWALPLTAKSVGDGWRWAHQGLDA